jgi:hypothetical protein
MFMKNIVFVLSLFLMASTASAQSQGRPPMPPGVRPGMEPMATLKSSYPDSAAFQTEFNELYLLIKPTPDIQERTETSLKRMAQMFKTRGIDSAKAYDSVKKAIDPSMDQKILFNAYRSQFSAEELKTIVAFFKTPAGKHYLEVENKLFPARNAEIDQYVGRTVNKVVMPMGKPPAPGAPRPGMGRPGMLPAPNQPMPAPNQPAPPTPPTPPTKD